MFVALHELAHVMSSSIGHTEEFWDNFRYLLKKLLKLIFIENTIFKKNLVNIVAKITDSPLK